MDRHVRLLSTLYIVGGSAGAVLGLLLLLKLGAVSNFMLALLSTRLVMSIPFAAMYLGAVAWLSLLVAVPAIVSGYGLRRYHDWARMLGLVVALVEILSFPFGTVLGVYAIWVLLSPESEYLFLEPPERRPARPRV